MAVVIRMKQMGRTHRPFYRICAADRRTPRDGRVIEELGTYDPSVADTNARCTLNAARVDYWLGVGAQPSDEGLGAPGPERRVHDQTISARGPPSLSGQICLH